MKRFYWSTVLEKSWEVFLTLMILCVAWVVIYYMAWPLLVWMWPVLKWFVGVWVISVGIAAVVVFIQSRKPAAPIKTESLDE